MHYLPVRNWLGHHTLPPSLSSRTYGRLPPKKCPFYAGSFLGRVSVLAQEHGGLSQAPGCVFGARLVDHVGQAAVAAYDPPHASVDLVRDDPRERLRLAGQAALETVAVGAELELNAF